MDIALTFKDLIPELEMQFINQHLQLRNIAVEEDCKIYKYIPKKSTNFKDDLFTMMNQFAFHWFSDNFIFSFFLKYRTQIIQMEQISTDKNPFKSVLSV